MSIVNRHDERVFPVERPRLSRPVNSAKKRERNRNWLRTQRALRMSIRDLAEFVNQPASTVAAGLAWAEDEEQLAEERYVESVQSLVLEPISGLTVDDVCFLMDEHPPGSELGTHPLVRLLLDQLYARVVALYPEIGALGLVSAA